MVVATGATRRVMNLLAVKRLAVLYREKQAARPPLADWRRITFGMGFGAEAGPRIVEGGPPGQSVGVYFLTPTIMEEREQQMVACCDHCGSLTWADIGEEDHYCLFCHDCGRFLSGLPLLLTRSEWRQWFPRRATQEALVN